MPRKKPHLSVIVPVYNESNRISKLETIIKTFKNKEYPVEILVVNDGSTDDTVKKLRILNQNNKLQIISYRRNKGKGFAIKNGMLKANGNYRLFMDVDLSTHPDEFTKFERYIDKHDVIIGSRRIKGSKFIAHQPLIREQMGKVFTKLSQTVLQLNLCDFTCGFKMFSEKASKEIFSRQTIDRWGFDSEIMFLANKLGYSIKEVPVKWKNDLNSKVKFPNDIIRSLSDLTKITINHKNNVYRLKLGDNKY